MEGHTQTSTTGAVSTDLHRQPGRRCIKVYEIGTGGGCIVDGSPASQGGGGGA